SGAHRRATAAAGPRSCGRAAASTIEGEFAAPPSKWKLFSPSSFASPCPGAIADVSIAVMPIRSSRPLPPHLYFVVSALFHYLGPAFAVLLFARVAPLGVAWLRIVSAALVFALWRRPWRSYARLTSAERRTIVALGVVLALMNCA